MWAFSVPRRKRENRGAQDPGAGVTGRYTDLNSVGTSDKNVREVIDWNPTWGGVGDLLTDQTMQIDHLYINGGS
jgi:hypothetical protein